jgi:glycosyltransferase involved in cell wall biosynthesis
LTEGLRPEDVPSVSLHVLAKNAESVIGRLLDCILPYVREVRLILNDTTDATRAVVEGRFAARANVALGSQTFGPQTLGPQTLDVQEVTSVSHPHFYFPDVSSSYDVGDPLDGETFQGPFTNQPLLCDWAGVRNLGWGSSSAWRLFLDADDVVEDPQKLPGLVRVLEDVRADLAATRYTFGRSESGAANSVSYRERLARNEVGRNGADIHWTGKTHEILQGGLRHVLVEDCFFVTDMKDNWGRGVRVPGRCFKVLYRDARLAKWEVSSRHLAYLVQEAPGMMPLSWVNRLVGYYLSRSSLAEEEAWVLSMFGEMHEGKELFAPATNLYRAALSHYPSSKTAFRLCRSLFMQKDWRGCVEAYERGVRNLGIPQVLDLGPVYEHSSKLLVAQALCELGELVRARDFVDEAVKSFPGSSTVLALRDSIHGKISGDVL